MSETITLVAKQVRYFSSFDENAFFYWLNKIEGISWRGMRDELHIDVPAFEVPDDVVRELIALFFRYEIELKQIRNLINASNNAWISNPKAYWASRM